MKKNDTQKVPDHPPRGFDADFVGALAEFLQGARMLKGVYDAFVEAGFTPEQALVLTAEAMRG